MEKPSKETSSNLMRVRALLVALLLLVFGGIGGYQLGVRAGESRAYEGGSVLEAVIGKAGDKSQVDFDLFWEVWERLEQGYLESEKIDAQEMVYGSIKGMTAALDDPYTVFLPPEENTQTKEDLAGEFAGVGIQLGYVEKTLAVMAPLPDQPAQKAGVKAGDLILHIKDEEQGIDIDTDGMSLPEAVQTIRGEKGKPITLTLYTEGDVDSREVTLIRDTIVVPSVELAFVNDQGRVDDNGRFAHLRVVRFGDKTLEEWEEAVREILAKPNLEGVVVDVRDNPGGYLQGAIDLASEFISSGVVVQQQGKFRTEKYSVSRRGKLIGEPLVVLVNRGSASASEILAGALRDQLKVKLVGEHTFGKGTVQEAQELPGGAGLHVTVAKWLLPSGYNIHLDGIEPDVVVESVFQPEGEEEVDEQLIKAVEVLKG